MSTEQAPNRRRGAATAATGLTMAAGGGYLRERGINRALANTGKRRPRFPRPLLSALGHGASGQSRLMYGAGSALGIAGAPAVAFGGYELTRRDKVRKAADKDQPYRSFIGEGIAGTGQALRARGENLREPHSPKAVATSAGVGAGAGLGGSLATHRVIDRFARHSTKRPALTAVGGTLAAVGSLPLTNRAVQRVAPGYQMTPTGVKRRKRAPVRPSRSARVVETRASHGATPDARRQIVPSDRRFAKALETDYPGRSMTRGQKRAAVYAAGGPPIVGDVTSAAMAARLAPPEQRRSAAALQFTGSQGGGLAGGAAGAYGTALAARKIKSVDRGTTSADAFMRRQHERVATTKPVRTVRASAPGRAVASGLRNLKTALPRGGKAGAALAKPLRAKPAAAAVGALVGSHAGGLGGGWVGYGAALNREEKRNAAIGKRGRISKAGEPRILTAREQAEQLRRKKRNLGIATVSNTIGAAGTGTFVASLALRKPKYARAQRTLERASLGTAVAGGTAGAIAGYRNAAVTRRDLRDQEARLRRSGVMKADNQGHDRRREELIGAGAAGGGYATSPTRSVQVGRGRKQGVTRLRGYGNGVHNMPIHELDPFRRAPGIRFGNRAHTAALAQNIQRQGFNRRNPVDVKVFHDRAIVSNGAHRLWAQNMLGASHVPVRLTVHDRKSPRAQPRAVQRLYDARTGYFKHRVNADRGMGPTKIREAAAKAPTGLRAKANRFWSHQGNAREDFWDRRFGMGHKAKLTGAGALGGAALMTAATHRRHPVDKALRSPTFRRSSIAMVRQPTGRLVPVRRANTVAKLDTTMDHKNAHSLVGQYGLRGPLPKELARPERMRAYEARYIVGGGPKGEHWQRRATRADRVTGGALALGGASALAELAGRGHLRGHANRVGLGSVAAGTASELFHRHAERKARSSSSSPAGVAASALSRMRDYTPENER